MLPIKSIFYIYVRDSFILSESLKIPLKKSPNFFSPGKIEGVKRVKMDIEDNFANFLLGIKTDDYMRQFYEKELLKKYERLKDKMGKIPQNDKKYYFLTINPPPNIDLRVFLKAIQKALSKKWITYYEYVIEQRGETLEELGKGFHTHIIFNNGIKHCKVVSEMTNSFKKILDFGSPYIGNWFKLKNIDEDEMKRKTSYILDRKSEPEKWLKQDMDIIFREKFGLQKSYKYDSTI